MRAVIFGNGTIWEVAYERGLIRPDDLILCADGGSRHAQALDVVPHRVVGDADSLPAAVRAWLIAYDVPFEAYPHEKDDTDFELALDVALAAGATRVLMLGATGTRVDHTFANISLLARAKRAGVAAEIVSGFQHCWLIWDETVEIEGEPGQTLSLLPWGGDAVGVSARGLYWPLADETLVFGEARGVSNVLLDTRAEVTVRRGCLLVVHHRGPVQ